ncbi:hypothetical protein SKUN_00520 [Spiroplasma kunkelii CR2-3x]|uniref:Uncharacterized protein n=1 Tax=Spiroplasma kunkelii CR2-3x TaxID=273035 RepID=A0A0K2JGQ2_SPIKU|nr:hypothetical protein [Spiroplasma kunkelii]ALA97421.1 hypothetical protein SKUN_00520 [Spiroplasma kunkelii CR2-3x]
MTKTVKEIEQIQDIIDFICSKHQTNVDDKLFKLYEIRNKMLYYENELAELKQQQLYKEDFDEYCQYVNGRREDTFIIKDKSLYKKLPNKDVEYEKVK